MFLELSHVYFREHNLREILEFTARGISYIGVDIYEAIVLSKAETEI